MLTAKGLILFIIMFSNIMQCFSSNGSWFDGMDFEDYKPTTNANENSAADHPKVPKIPCGLIIDGSDQSDASNVYPMSTIVGTGLKKSTISKDAVEKNAALKYLVVEQDKQEIIPKGALWLRMGTIDATVPSPEMHIVKSTSDDKSHVKLGMDFLTSHHAMVDAEKGELTIRVNNKEIKVSFVQSRDSSSSDDL